MAGISKQEIAGNIHAGNRKYGYSEILIFKYTVSLQRINWENPSNILENCIVGKGFWIPIPSLYI